jgi:hypothetical protein
MHLNNSTSSRYFQNENDGIQKVISLLNIVSQVRLAQSIKKTDAHATGFAPDGQTNRRL